MERKIGETFEYNGKTYKVVEVATNTCIGCTFEGVCPHFSDIDEDGLEDCVGESRTDGKDIIFVEVKPEEKHDAVEEVLRLMPPEKTEIPSDLYKRLVYLGIIDPTGTRDSNVGASNYSRHLIQPWAIWQDWGLNPWDADIVKRVLRNKHGESRKMDYEKIIHICQERIRQIDTNTPSNERKD